MPPPLPTPIYPSQTSSAAAFRSRQLTSMGGMADPAAFADMQARIGEAERLLLRIGGGGGGVGELESEGGGSATAELLAQLAGLSRSVGGEGARPWRVSSSGAPARPPPTYGGLSPAAYDATEWAWAEAMGELPTAREWAPPSAAPAPAPPAAVPAAAAAAATVAPPAAAPAAPSPSPAPAAPPAPAARATAAAGLSEEDIAGLRQYLDALQVRFKYGRGGVAQSVQNHAELCRLHSL